jgi:hypothetical protein
LIQPYALGYDAESERLTVTGTSMKVRGHHLGCVYCYLGSGKDRAEEFFGVANAIPELVDRLRGDPGLEITVTDCLDDVCDLCPLHVQKGCGRGIDPAAHDHKLCQWDRAILARLGLTAGDTVLARQLESLLRERIPDVGEICTKCTSASANRWQDYRLGIGKGLWDS